MSMTGNNTAFLRWDPQVTSPFSTLSRRVYPRTMREVFSWAEELWLHHGIYSGSIQKAVRHFITDIQVKSGDINYKTAGKYVDSLKSDLKIMDACVEVGDEFFAFGNVMTTLQRNFVRHLYCPVCGQSGPLKMMHGQYAWANGEFRGSCPNPRCDFQGVFNVRDLALTKTKDKPRIKRWPAQYMQIKEHPISGRKQIACDFSRYEQLYTGIMQSDPLYLEETPWQMIVAITQQKLYQFNEGDIYHLRNDSLSCFHPNLKGWGLPPFMADFELALLIYMLDKYTEAFLTDYLVPFRVLSPGGAGSASDEGNPLLNMNMADFTSAVKGMLARHRRNPTDFNFLPYPLQYQVLGGEAKDLVPIEIQEHFERRLLYIMGIPSYLTNPEGDSNANPLIGYKMFTRTWQNFISALNDWLTWVSNKRGEMARWEDVSVRLISQDIEEDPAIRQVKMDLMANNQMSREDGYRSLGMDWKEQFKKTRDEADWEKEQLQEQEERDAKEQANRDALRQPATGETIIQAEQAQQGAVPGAMPPPVGGPQPMTPAPAPGTEGSATIEDLLYQADTQAQQLLVMDPLQRDRQLASMKATDEALYAQTKVRLQQLEQQARQQGVVMARQGQVPVQ